MKAIVIDRYGSANVLQYEEVEQPQIKPSELLVKVQGTSVNPLDWKVRRGMVKWLMNNKFPKILGADISGEVVQVGTQVTRFQPGDEIYASLSSSSGAYAEFVAVSEKLAALKPTNLTHSEAGVVPLAALTALQALRNLGKIKSGSKVLINGASGGVGIFAVQIAKAFDVEVTGVCSQKNWELVKSLGCDRTLDYRQTDFTQDTIQYDIVFDAVAKSSFWQCRTILKPNGIYVSTLPTFSNLVAILSTAIFSKQKAKFILFQANGQDLLYIKELIETGKLHPVIDRTYSLPELAQAHKYSESQRAVGKISIIVK
ncbi:NAD(P)-dependent alcohol dehydrogenase [Pleurocapsa sp. PCC 7319]|uniref:NAD(P)-dependent alcohol dehydrogenase n=1 Tax=Pleurocapsa sp. PCC 7319 TaxID=118161 RepID=UPI00034BD194|nr:NAD(P)-dependent alcohol dehydrogenase [Pleurocapsa sp. PCC 7319]